MSQKQSITLNFPNKLLKYEFKEYLEYNFKVYVSKQGQDLVIYGSPEDLILCQEQAEYFKSVNSQCLLLLNEFSEKALSILSLKLFIQSKCKVLYKIDSNILYIFGQFYNSTQTYNYLCYYNNLVDKDDEFDFSEIKNNALKVKCEDFKIKVPNNIPIKTKLFIYLILNHCNELFNQFDNFTCINQSKLFIESENSSNSAENCLEKLQIEEPKQLVIESPKVTNVIISNSAERPKIFRVVIIDGGNVAHQHGNNKFSYMGIKLAVDYFINRGHKKVYAMLSKRWQSFGGKVFEQLEGSGYLKYTPSRRINNVRETPHDDRLILDAAVATNGIVVSNDQYREHMVIDKYKQVICNRLIAFTFIGDHIIIPHDPFGPRGPSLDDILVYQEEFQSDSLNTLARKINSPAKTKNIIVSNQTFERDFNLKDYQLELFRQVIEIFPNDGKVIKNIIKANPKINEVDRIVNLLMTMNNQ